MWWLPAGFLSFSSLRDIPLCVHTPHFLYPLVCPWTFVSMNWPAEVPASSPLRTAYVLLAEPASRAPGGSGLSSDTGPAPRGSSSSSSKKSKGTKSGPKPGSQRGSQGGLCPAASMRGWLGARSPWQGHKGSCPGLRAAMARTLPGSGKGELRGGPWRPLREETALGRWGGTPGFPGPGVGGH